MYVDLFGDEVVRKMGSTLGGNMEGIYELAKQQGSTVTKEEVIQAFYARANRIYSTAPIPEGIDELLNVLRKRNFQVGIVSASPKEWIDIVLKRLRNKEVITHIISLFDRSDLAHKPEPDGYLEAIKFFNTIPENTIVLEDSNAGIASAKASGAYTIGLKQHLVPGYEQEGADIYANSINDVIKIVGDVAK